MITPQYKAQMMRLLGAGCPAAGTQLKCCSRLHPPCHILHGTFMQAHGKAFQRAGFDRNSTAYCTHIFIERPPAMRSLAQGVGESGRGVRTPAPCTSQKFSSQTLVHARQQRHRQRRLPITAANVPQEGGPAVSRADLIEYMRSGCKPRSKWLIGTEHEKLGFNLSDHTRMDYAKINQVFDKLQERFGWEPMTEGDLVIGVKQDGQSVTLEPGGQFELSGAPLATLHQTCAEVNSHLYQVKTIGEELGIGFLGTGFDPKWAVEQVPIMPKNRYRLMKAYMPTVGTMGLDMMFRTCTIQVGRGAGVGKAGSSGEVGSSRQACGQRLAAQRQACSRGGCRVAAMGAGCSWWRSWSGRAGQCFACAVR